MCPLQAFVRYDQELGYWPGLGFVGGLILSQVGDGELAFWSLVSLLQNDVSVFKHDMRQFFPAGHEELRIATLAFGFVLEQSEPKLAKRFVSFPFTLALSSLSFSLPVRESCS